jgi:hypothetical protein
MLRQSGAFIFGCVHLLIESDQRSRVDGPQAKLPEFWCEMLSVVAGIRLRMAKAIFPYLQRYRSKGLTDARADIVLVT